MTMYMLPRNLLLCLTSLLFTGVGALVALAPAAAGPGLNAAQPTPTPAPISSMIALTGPVLDLRSAIPAARPSPAASPPGTVTFDPSLLGGVPSGLRSLIIGASPNSPGCTPSNTNEAFPSIDVFYWPTASSNTACLSTITEQLPARPQPTGMVPPYVYVVYPPLAVYDGCGNFVQNDYQPDEQYTHTYPVEDMSTLQDIPGAAPVTQVFNFNDLPCPPPAIATRLDPGSAYRPVVLSNWEIPLINGNGTGRPVEISDDVVADPSRAIVQVRAITGPGGGVPP